MERLEPKSLKGARSYFTNFDQKIIERTRDIDQLQKNAERKLKILLLTKNIVVCSASLMTTEFSYNFFRNNKVLLDRKLIIPALRRDKNHVEDYIEKSIKDKNLQNEVKAFYIDSIQKTVNWDLQDNSTWFRDGIVKSVSKKDSLIRRNLAHASENNIQNFVDFIKNQQNLDRITIEEGIATFPMDAKEAMLNYRDLLYHVSGARVVNCESTLPQENYVDFSLADLSERKVFLSETQIFWKLFLDIFFETINKPKIPIEILDYLSFDDISKIRAPLLDSSFINSYNELIEHAVDSINDSPENLLYNVEQLLKIKDVLAKHFKEVFDKELTQKTKKQTGSSEKLKNNMNIGLGLPLFKVKGVQDDFTSPSTIMNLHQNFNSYRAVNNYYDYIENKGETLQDVISQIGSKDKNTLSDVIEMLFSVINTKSTFS